MKKFEIEYGDKRMCDFVGNSAHVVAVDEEEAEKFFLEKKWHPYLWFKIISYNTIKRGERLLMDFIK